MSIKFLRIGLILLVGLILTLWVNGDRVEAKAVSTSIYNIPTASFPVSQGELLKSINELRAQKGLKPLKESTTLDLIAYKRVQDIKDNQYFSHDSKTGQTFDKVASQVGYKYSLLGENLSIGYTTGPAIVLAWFNSPSHQAILLNPQYTEVGLASQTANIKPQYAPVLAVAIFGKGSKL